MEKTMIIAKLREVKTTLFAEILEKIEKIEKISSNFTSTNLKLHNVSHYLYEAEEAGLLTDEQNIQMFQWICEREYEYFQEWEQENLNYVTRSYIGRTSSFYYDSHWYGEVLDNDLLEKILEGNSFDNDSNDVFSSLDYRLYTYLKNNIAIEGEFTDWDEVEFIEWLEEEENTLHNINDDLETFYEIVLEAEKAYNYLAEYKTEECEQDIAYEYLFNEITEYYSERKASELFDKILDNISHLNTISMLKISPSVDNSEYYINVITNESNFSIQTRILTNHDLSEHTFDMVTEQLQFIIDSNFKF